jgi:hypothetical protein
MGALPAAGSWVRLEVPASLVGMEGRTLSGMGFVLYDGRATWDHAGKASSASPPPPALPVVQVVASDALARRREANEGVHPEQPNPGEFVFWRNGDTRSDLTVYYTPGGTTANGADYVTLPGSVTIPAGSSYATVTLMPFVTGVDGGSVVLTVKPDASYRVGSFGSATVTIVSQMYLPDGFFVANVFTLNDTVPENGRDPGVFIVTRTQADMDPVAPMTVYYRLPGSPATGCGQADTLGNAVNGVDFQPVSGTVTIPAGKNFAFVTITPMNDAVFKGTRSAYFTIAQNCQAPYVVADDKFGYFGPRQPGQPSTQAVFITDDDPPPANDKVWVDDSLPDGAWSAADGGDGWNWVGSGPTPFSGSLAHQSSNSPGLHEHFFNFAANQLAINPGDALFAYVYLHPSSPTKELMLSWCDGAGWEHRAYWGADDIDYGQPGTTGRYYVGPLPSVGQWVRLEVPASAVGLEGGAVQGMSFSLFDGSATWDAAGKSIRATPPAAPINLYVQFAATKGNVLQLSWHDEANNEAGFRVERSTDNATFAVVATVGSFSNGSTPVWFDYNAQADTTYYYRVRAFNAAGDSDYSNTTSITTRSPPPPPPVAPTNLSAAATSSSAISLAWTDNANNENTYYVERSPDSASFVFIAALDPNTTTYTDTGLSPSTTYYYRVHALNGGGYSAYSNIASATTQQSAPSQLSAPTNLRVTHRGDREIDLAWDDNSVDETGFVIELRHTDYLDHYVIMATVGSNVTQFAATGLREGDSLSFLVRAVRDTVSSAYSLPAGTTVTITPILNATGVTSSSISMYWSEPIVNKAGPGNGPYSLERSTDNVNFVQIAGGLHTTSYNRTDYTDAGLPAAMRYYYRVRYLDTNGNTSGYGTLPPITTDGPPPATPTN